MHSLILLLFLINLNFIPEPGILFYGYLRDDSCLLQEDTPLHWTITPVAGGDTLRLTSFAVPIAEQKDLYGYKVLIPLATPIAGCPAPEGSVLVATTPQSYLRQLQIGDANLVRTDTIQLGAADRGTFRLRSLVW